MSPRFPADETASAFPMLDHQGHMIGFVDSIASQAGQISVTGWTSAGEVGLQTGTRRIIQTPDLLRQDVLEAFPDFAKPGVERRLGFHLRAEATSDTAYFFVCHGADTYYFLI